LRSRAPSSACAAPAWSQALLAGFAIEGRVPARKVKRHLRERPNALGLAAPGMPVGSPGIDGPEYNGQVDPYQLPLVQADGRGPVSASIDPGLRRRIRFPLDPMEIVQ